MIQAPAFTVSHFHLSLIFAGQTRSQPLESSRVWAPLGRALAFTANIKKPHLKI